MTWALTLALLALSRPDGVHITSNSYALGKRYSVVITQAALDKAPVWKDDADNPPLPARKAIRSAGALKDRLVKDTDDWKWEMGSASLHRATEMQWYWQVEYVAYPKGGALTGFPPSLRLVVLMDGTVIEPTVTDDKP